jgi:fatty acid desaturase
MQDDRAVVTPKAITEGSPEVLELQQFSTISHGWTMLKLAMIICALAASMFLFKVALVQGGYYWFLVAVSFLCSVWVQHAMAEEVHDGVHYRLTVNRRMNNFLSGIYSSMMGASYSAFRTAHLMHHRHFGTPDDPDYPKYTSCPQSAAAWLRYFAFNFSGVAAVYSVAFGGRNKVQDESRDRLQHPLGTFAVQAGLIAGSWLFVPYWYICYVGALVTVSYGIAQLRTLLEHCNPEMPTGSLFNSPGVVGRNLFAAQFGYNYHGTHHLYPSVSNHKLGKFTRINEDCLNHAGVSSQGYVRRIIGLISGTRR